MNGPSREEKLIEESSVRGLERWYIERGSRDVRSTYGQPLPPLPIAGHQCSVPGCIGYVRVGPRCAEHARKAVS